MPSFLTQCPHCLTSFRVTDAQLDAAEGLVRCGACLGIFSAAANRITLKQSPEDGVELEELGELEDEGFEEEDFKEEDFEEVEDELQEFDSALEFDDDDALVVSPTEELVVSPQPIPDTLSTEITVVEGAAAEILEARSPAPEVNTDAGLMDAEDFDIPLGDFNLDGDEPLDEDGELTFEDDEADAGDDVDDDEAYEDDEFEDDEEEYEEDEEEYEEDEEELEDEDDDDEYEEEDEVGNEDEAIYEEYEDETPVVGVSAQDDAETLPEEFEPEIHFEDDDVEFLGPADEILFATDDEDEYEEEVEEEEDDEGQLEERPLPVPPRGPGERISGDKTELRRYLATIEDDDALGTIDDDAALDAIDEPVMLDSASGRSRLAGVALFVANLLLAGVLLLQVAHANIDALSRNPRLAFLMPVVCSVFECPLPERSRLDLFVSEQLLVRSHPRFAQALEVNLVFRNDATVAQPFPALELGFLDTGNRPLANRLFAPSEYLPPELRTSEMPAQSSLQVTLELADPGSEAVNYTLAFRRPQ